MSGLKTFFRLTQSATAFNLQIRFNYNLEPKSAVVVVRGFLEDGSEAPSISGLSFSKQLGGHFRYLPEGSNPEWFEFSNVNYSDPITALRVDLFPWGKAKEEVVPWNEFEIRLNHTIVSESLSPKSTIIGSFQAVPEEVL